MYININVKDYVTVIVEVGYSQAMTGALGLRAKAQARFGQCVGFSSGHCNSSWTWAYYNLDIVAENIRAEI